MNLLSKKAAAAFLCVSTDTVMSEFAAGRLLGFKVGGIWKFDERDLTAYVDEKRRNAAMGATAVKNKGRRPVRLPAGLPVNTVKEPIYLPGMRIQDVCAPDYVRK